MVVAEGGSSLRSDARVYNPYVERLSHVELARLVEARVLDHVRRTYDENPFYRRRYAEEGVDPHKLRSLADFRKYVPFISKADLVADQELAPPYGTRTTTGMREFHLTSGTSGSGREVHPLDDNDIEALGVPSMYQWHWAGLAPGSTIALTLPYGVTLAGPYFVRACQAYGVVPLQTAGMSAEERLAIIDRFKPTALLAVPAYIHRLGFVAREMGIDPAKDMPYLRFLFTAAEPFGVEWAQQTEEFWGARMFEWFGATQTAGATMFSCEEGVLTRDGTTPRHGALHNLDHRTYIEVIDPDTLESAAPGEPGEMTATVLSRTAFPCIRFRMGDRITPLADDACPCGRPFSVFESGTISRFDDMMKIRGLNVWPEAVDAVVLHAPGVEEYRGTVSVDPVTGRELVEIEIEPTIGVAAGDQLAIDLHDRLAREVGLSAKVVIASPGSLPRYDFKVRRWVDTRKTDREVVHYVE